MAVITVQASTLNNIWPTASAAIPAAPELRIGCNDTFVAADGTQIEPYPFSYVPVTCSYNGTTGVLSIPQFTLESTIDGQDIQTALYTFYLFSGPGINATLISQLRGLIAISLDKSPTTTNLPAIQLAARTNINVYPWNATGTIAQIISAFYSAVPFPPNSTTPSVLNKYSFYTTNTVATNITNFLNGYAGQVIYVFVNDGNTSIFGQHYSQGSWLTFGFNGTSWKAQVPQAGVNSFNGRQGDVMPQAGDYTAAMVTNAADITQANVFQQFQTILAATASWFANSNDAAGSGRFIGQNDVNDQVIMQIFGHLAAGNAFTGGPPNANLCELRAFGPNLVIQQDSSDGTIWFATNGVLRATLSSVALLLAPGLPLRFQGATSGQASLNAQAVAGNYNFHLPNVDPILGQVLSAAAVALPDVALGWSDGGSGTTNVYDLATRVDGTTGANQLILNFVACRTFNLGITGSTGIASVAATAQTDFLITVNGVTKGTLRFAAGATTISVVGASPTVINAGDVIQILAPAVPDATLATISFTLKSATPTGTAYDLSSQVNGDPIASQKVMLFVAARAFTLGLSNSRGNAGTAATAQTDFLVTVNGVLKATIRFAAGATTTTVIAPTSTAIVAGDVVTITAPATPDATIADVTFTLDGTIP